MAQHRYKSPAAEAPRLRRSCASNAYPSLVIPLRVSSPPEFLCAGTFLLLRVMMRLLLLPLFLFTLSMACMGQTFQYSRGWTNGKRALNAAPSPLLGNNGHFHRSNELGYTDLYDLQDWSSERRLERCLSQLQRSLIGRNCRNPATDLNRVGDADSGDNSHLLPRLNGNLNSENVVYSNINSNSNRHRQSNELLEELSAAASGGGGGSSSEPNVFGKH